MGIAGVGLAATIWLLLLFVEKAPAMIAQGISNKFFYVLLLPLGLCVTAFVFGGMRTYASLTTTTLNTTLNLVGPGVGVLMVVVGGFWLVPETPPFNITARFRDPAGKLLKEGFATIYKRQARDREPITTSGEATFKDIADRFRTQSTRIDLEAPGYVLKEPQKSYPFSLDVFEVDVIPDEKYVNEQLIEKIVGVPKDDTAQDETIRALKELEGKTLSDPQRNVLMQAFRNNTNEIGKLLDAPPADLEERVRNLVKIACPMQTILGEPDFWKQTKARIQKKMIGFELNCR
jgi:hypothetical protein